jgi:hypothetical protein
VKQLHLKDSSEYPPGGAIAEACEDLIQEGERAYDRTLDLPTC